MHPLLSRPVLFYIYLQYSSSTQLYKKKLKKSPRCPRRKTKDGSETTDVNDFFSTTFANLSTRLLFRSWDLREVEGAIVRVSKRMHFCAENEREAERRIKIDMWPLQLLTLAGEGPLTKGGGARFFGLARGSSS